MSLLLLLRRVRGALAGSLLLHARVAPVLILSTDMTATERLYVGQTVPVNLRARDPESRALADPSGALMVSFFSPTPSTPPVVIAATRVSTGKYVAKIEPDVDGLWRFRAESDPPDVVVTEGSFLVEPSAV